MRKLILLIVCIASSTIAFSQSVFDKYEGNDDVTSVVVNKKMFQMLGNVKAEASDVETRQYFKLISNLDNLKVFTTENAKLAADMKATVSSYLKSNPLEELMRVNSEGKKVNIYVKSGSSEQIVKELLMFIEPNANEPQTVVLSLTGNFNLDDLSALTDKMNLPGGEELKKASKK